MANCILGWINQVQRGSLSTGSAASGLDASQLQNPIGSSATAWQTAAGTTSSWLQIDAGSSVSWGAFGIFRTNLTSAAQVRWRVSDDAAFATVIYDSGTIAAGIVPGIGQSIVVPFGGIVQTGGGAAVTTDGGDTVTTESGQSVTLADTLDNQLTLEDGTPLIMETGEAFILSDASTTPVFGVSVAGRYARLDISDTGNPAGFLNIALVYAGASWMPARNFSWSSSQGRNSQATRVTTRGGQVYISRLWQQRLWKLQFQGIRDSEVWPDLMELDDAARAGSNILFVPNPADPNIHRNSIFGVLDPTSDLGFAFQSRDTRGWAATVSERL